MFVGFNIIFIRISVKSHIGASLSLLSRLYFAYYVSVSSVRYYKIMHVAT